MERLKLKMRSWNMKKYILISEGEIQGYFKSIKNAKEYAKTIGLEEENSSIYKIDLSKDYI